MYMYLASQQCRPVLLEFLVHCYHNNVIVFETISQIESINTCSVCVKNDKKMAGLQNVIAYWSHIV